MEHKEALEPVSLVCHPSHLQVTLNTLLLTTSNSHLVQGHLDLLLADGVVTPGVVVGGVLFACDQLLGVEQLPVGPGADLTRVFMNISSTALMNVFCTLSSTRFEYLLCNFRQKRY